VKKSDDKLRGFNTDHEYDRQTDKQTDRQTDKEADEQNCDNVSCICVQCIVQYRCK